MDSQVDLNQERRRLIDKFTELVPGLMTVERAVINEAYKEGALSTKTKRLMAMVLALGAGCTNCTLAQSKNALDAGATKEEMLEALSVVVSMRGTTGIAEVIRVIKFMEELGKL